MKPPPPALPLLALLLAACAPPAQPRGCGSDGDCPSGASCRAGVCLGGSRPTAVIAPVAAVEAFALVQLDGRSSAGDGLAEHVWSARAVSARCDPPEVAGREPVAAVRFGCPGTFEVGLTVRDRLGVESAPAALRVEVAPSTAAPVVLAGADVATEHLCAGSPLRCRTADPVTLSAAAAPGLALRWTVEAPLDRPLEDGSRAVRFVSAAAAETRVEIETDGSAISGDWIFRVEARDAYGAVGAAYTRVSVRNRPPVLRADPPASFPHAFDAIRSVFTAEGAVGWSVSDPDGDPVEVGAIWIHAGDGGALFEGALGETSVTFAVEVPWAGPADALRLRGGADLERRIALFARDVNRGEGRLDVPVEIGNRPPRPEGGVVDASVPHVFDAPGARYVATARLGSWSDPDGDPLLADTGVAPCAAVTMEEGLARVTCEVPYEGVPAVERLAGLRSVPVRIRDPWGEAAAVPVYALEIQNRPPALEVTRDVAEVPSSYVIARPLFPCVVATQVAGVAFTASPAVSDPDGDPILLRPAATPGGTASPTEVLCAGGPCVPVRFDQPPQLCSCTRPCAQSTLTASDGAASATAVASPPIVVR